LCFKFGIPDFTDREGVRELWSADRDFSRFAGLKALEPLLRGGPK